AHAGFNTLGAALYAASLAARTNGGSLQAKVLGMAGWLSLACGAYTGGHIAHSMGIGVDQTAFETPPTDWTTVCEESAVGEAPIAVQAGDVPVMVVRDKGEIKALANRCTHRGGPLNEGRIDDGCVVCPWHQSTFDLSTGEIRRGPAASPQPAFETRVIDGAVQVRVKPETVA
ncbi:MAG TPA: Rieske (2Fe-2S) protein, partial [Actinomycetota bacterium]|nr:Rieske (2Fe-2S) protein [Actinomycetota bacterium]